MCPPPPQPSRTSPTSVSPTWRPSPLPLQLPAGEEGGGGSGAGSASSSSSSSSGMENFTFILTDQDGGRVFGVCLRFLPPGDGQRFGIKVRRRFLSRCLKLSLSVCLFV